MKYYCNPININYRYQFNKDPRIGKVKIVREAADPSMICFKDKYYIFASMNLSVWVSEDLVNWEAYRLPENLPLYDYAPDVRVCGDYVYFSASKKMEICNFYRTKDIINGPYEEIPGSFEFWDPNLFFDDDGRIYFYWGCSNMTPIWGVELEPETMKQKTAPVELISGNPYERGYERFGEDNSLFPSTEEQIEMMYQGFLKQTGTSESAIPPQLISMVKGMFTNKPFIEGAWMDKHNGKYYLQYAAPGTQFNTYCDAVFVGASPLGPFKLAKNNPYSYAPGGFMPGAGHGSTMWDMYGNLWHTSTMRISVNQQFERRVGLWPAGFDKDGELFCNQRYNDWPRAVVTKKADPWENPNWYLLSFGKPVKASSFVEGKDPYFATEENVKNWWQAKTNESGEWIEVDLEKSMDVHAIQINFADDKIDVPVPGEIKGTMTQPRYIDEYDRVTRWMLEGSLDGENYFVIEDKSKVDTDLSHDLVVRADGFQARFIKLTILEVPFAQAPCISGLRVFGIGDGKKPSVPAFEANRSEDELDLLVSIKGENAVGYNIIWGHEPEKLYHSWLVYHYRENIHSNKNIEKRIGALVKGEKYYVRVDAFNENGITEGVVIPL